MILKQLNDAVEYIEHNLEKDLSLDDIAKHAGLPKQVVNVSYDADENFLKDGGYLTHMIGVLTTDDSISEKLETFDVPANKWAVFPNAGEFPKVMQDTTARAAAEWLPSTGYTLSDVPNFSFTIMSEDKKDHAYSEIWMAIE